MRSKLFLLIGNGLAEFLDFGMGVLLGALAAWCFGTSLSLAELFVAGVLAVSPDFDVALPLLAHGRPMQNHHELPAHRPPLMFALATPVAWMLGGSLWAVVTFLCLFWHYVHDTKGLGGGIAWFWPCKLYWSPWSGWQRPEDSIMATSSEGHVAWVEAFLRPSKRSWSELMPGAVALGIGISYNEHSPALGAGVTAFAVAVIMIIWTCWGSAGAKELEHGAHPASDKAHRK